MTAMLLADATGWAGAACLLLAYARLSSPLDPSGELVGRPGDYGAQTEQVIRTASPY